MSINTNLRNIYVPSNQPDLKLFNIHGPTMGTRYSASFYAPSSTDLAKLHRYLQRVVDAVDNQMSPWKEQSDLVRVNKAPIGKWVDIPLEMAVVINKALQVSRQSNGIFNIGVGNLVDIWGFGPSGRKVGTIPHKDIAIPSAHKTFELNMEQFALRRNAPASLDLCGIAKGFGVDELARILIDFRIEDFFVSIDGEVKIGGTKPDSKSWMVGIEKPHHERRETEINLEVSNIAIATSGDYRHFREFEGKQISHTMDAKAGKPVSNRTTSVTVASKNCLTADAWATALLAMDRQAAVTLANKLDIDALIYERHSDRIATFGTGEFSELIN